MASKIQGLFALQVGLVFLCHLLFLQKRNWGTFLFLPCTNPIQLSCYQLMAWNCGSSFDPGTRMTNTNQGSNPLHSVKRGRLKSDSHITRLCTFLSILCPQFSIGLVHNLVIGVTFYICFYCYASPQHLPPNFFRFKFRNSILPTRLYRIIPPSVA